MSKEILFKFFYLKSLELYYPQLIGNEGEASFFIKLILGFKPKRFICF